MTTQERIMNILSDISEGVYDKDKELRLAILAALAGESLLLLGPPGIAKSMIARQIKLAFKNAKAFEYLMSRFSTPDEVFGPVSITKLKESDKYERNTEGYLPEADVVFLDEIWKAGPAIQNTLLTVINEKLFRNGDKEYQLPLKLLIVASNELPAQGEGLEALWDRFLIRIVSGCIKNEQVFYDMLLDDVDRSDKKVKNPITEKELVQWQKDIKKVKVPANILATITVIRESLKSVETYNSEIKRNVYVSDRRWKKIINLLRASAFIHGRNEVDPTDVFVIHHCLWNNPDEYDDVRQIVMAAICTTLKTKLEELRSSLNDDIKSMQLQKASQQMTVHRYDRELKLFDSFYFHVENHGTGNTYIFANDFLNLTTDVRNPQEGIVYKEVDEKRSIIRTIPEVGMDDASNPKNKSIVAMKVKMYRDDLHLFINGIQMNLERLEYGEVQPELEIKNTTVSNRDYELEIEAIGDEIIAFEKSLGGNIFFSEVDIKAISGFFGKLKKDIAHTRVDIGKLLYT